jgi:hypothetical protein
MTTATCQHCDKIRYTNRTGAVRHLTMLQRFYPARSKGLAIYECPACSVRESVWHVGPRPQQQERRP